MARWGVSGLSRRKVPSIAVLKRYMDSRIKDGLAEIGKVAVVYAKSGGAPMETGALRSAQTSHVGMHQKGPWLALGWDVAKLQRGRRQTWKKLGGPRKAKPPASPEEATAEEATAEEAKARAKREGTGKLKPPSPGRGRFRTKEGPGKWFDYGTYQYFGIDWRSGKPLKYRMGGTDHWYLRFMNESNALVTGIRNRAINQAVIETFDKLWKCL